MLCKRDCRRVTLNCVRPLNIPNSHACYLVNQISHTVIITPCAFHNVRKYICRLQQKLKRILPLIALFYRTVLILTHSYCRLQRGRLRPRKNPLGKWYCSPDPIMKGWTAVNSFKDKSKLGFPRNKASFSCIPHAVF